MKTYANMSSYTLITLFFVAFGHHLCVAQGFGNLVSRAGKNRFTEGWIAIYFRYTDLAGTYVEPRSMPTLNASLRVDRAHPYGLRYAFENSTIGDALSSLMRGVPTNPTEKTLSSGLVGWHRLAINLVATDRFLLSPGFSAGDHMIGTTLRSTDLIVDAIGQELYSGGPVQRIDPAGYYFYAGPQLMATYVVSGKLWVNIHANYDFTVVKASDPSHHYVKDPSYPLPTVWMFGVDLYSTLNLFASVRYARLNDSGVYRNQARRLDFSLGFHF